MNVLLITVDSLRADRLTTEVMPQTRLFADEGLEFTDCVANGSSTPASFPSILASRHFASIEGLGIPEAGNILTLAERLQQEGYKTGGFTDNHFASGSYNFDRGFDQMYDAGGSTEMGWIKQIVQSNLDKDQFIFEIIEKIYAKADGFFSSVGADGTEYERAASLNKRALSFINDCDDDWFAWIHYMDPHHPYEAPKSYQESFLKNPLSLSECRTLSRKATHHPTKMNDDEWEQLESLYNAECRYVDDQFDDLLIELNQRDYLDETLTIFTADHGEMFGEHEKGGHPGEFWEEVIRVPLAISGTAPETTVDGQARLLDIAPTIVDALGLEPTTEWSGESLLPIIGEKDAIEFAFGDVGRDIDYEKGYVRRADGWKLLDHAENGEYLFDISKTPAELSADEKSDNQPEILAELQTEIRDHRERMAQLRGGVKGVDEDDAIIEEHLEDLGYI